MYVSVYNVQVDFLVSEFKDSTTCLVRLKFYNFNSIWRMSLQCLISHIMFEYLYVYIYIQMALSLNSLGNELYYKIYINNMHHILRICKFSFEIITSNYPYKNSYSR